MSLWQNAAPPISSPCTGVCRLGADGLCEGCRRTAEEIAGWSTMSEPERRRLMDVVLPDRAEPRS